MDIFTVRAITSLMVAKNIEMAIVPTGYPTKIPIGITKSGYAKTGFTIKYTMASFAPHRFQCLEIRDSQYFFKLIAIDLLLGVC